MKNKTTKKALIFIVLVSSLLWFGAPYLKDDNRIIKAELYKDSTEFQAAIQKLYPIGSNVELLQKSMELSGFVLETHHARDVPKGKQCCGLLIYDYKWGFLGGQQASLSVEYSSDKKIEKLIALRWVQRFEWI